MFPILFTLVIDEPICGSPTLLPSSSNCHQLPLAFDFTRMTVLVSAFPLLPAWAWPPATWARPSVRPSRSGLPHAQSTNAQCGPGGGITVSSLPVMHVRSRSVRREDGRGVELPGIGTDRILENTTLPKPCSTHFLFIWTLSLPEASCLFASDRS